MISKGQQRIGKYDKKGDLSRFKKLKGYLTDKEATKTLLDFLTSNLWIMVNLLFNIKLFPVQVLMLKLMFSRDRTLLILPRGFSKSWTTALFCCLYAIIHPNSKIGIASAVFRQSREIITTIEGFAKAKGADLFTACVGKVTHATDYWSINVGSSKITALPMGDKIRGYRFHLVIVDEMLLVSNEFINSVVLPFLSTNTDPVRQLELEKEEDRLIETGLLKKEDRTHFPQGKFIGLSSASYKFQDLYRMYEKYQRIIEEGAREEKDAEITYGLMTVSCEAAPEGLYRKGFIDSVRQELTDQQFKREMLSVFTDDSGGYFSLEKMLDCTVKIGESPTIEIVGNKDSEYIVSIDASFSDAEDSDFFAISVIKLDRENNKMFVVNAYEIAGGEQKDHIQYMAYLMKAFNVVMVIIDNAGWEFIDTCSNSAIFKELGLHLDLFDADFGNSDYKKALQDARRSYNKTAGKIVYKQYFGETGWIRKANEMLQISFNNKRLWFAAPLLAEEVDKFAKETSNLISIKELVFDKKCEYEDPVSKTAELIHHLPYVLNCIRKECSLIEIHTSPTGHQVFDLPGNLKRKKGPDRPRRDGYTSLFLGHYGAKCYIDMFSPDLVIENYGGFIPEFVA